MMKIQEDMTRDARVIERSDVIFAFAGGGTDGLGSLEILNVISQHLQKRGISEIQFLHFLKKTAVIVGTSTGSIITALLKTDNINPDTNKNYTIEDFKNMYLTLSPKLFGPNLRNLACCCISPYSRTELDQAAYKYLRNQKVYESDGLGITVFNKTKNESQLIAKHEQHSDYTLGDSAEASAAIPCAFAPKVIDNESYSDGGTCLANLHPTIEAYRYYKKLRKLESSIYKSSTVIIVDIGAGTVLNNCKGCIDSRNKGGLIASSLDNTCCECVQHLQHSGPEIVKELTEFEDFDVKIFKLDFGMQYPLAFTNSCLTNTVRVANTSATKYKDMDELIDYLYVSICVN